MLDSQGLGCHRSDESERRGRVLMIWSFSSSANASSIRVLSVLIADAVAASTLSRSSALAIWVLNFLVTGGRSARYVMGFGAACRLRRGRRTGSRRIRLSAGPYARSRRSRCAEHPSPAGSQGVCHCRQPRSASDVRASPNDVRGHRRARLVARCRRLGRRAGPTRRGGPRERTVRLVPGCRRRCSPQDLYARVESEDNLACGRRGGFVEALQVRESGEWEVLG